MKENSKGGVNKVVTSKLDIASSGAAARKRNISQIKGSPISNRRNAIPKPNGRVLIHQASRLKTSKLNSSSVCKHKLMMRSEIDMLATNDDHAMPFAVHETEFD